MFATNSILSQRTVWDSDVTKNSGDVFIDHVAECSKNVSEKSIDNAAKTSKSIVHGVVDYTANSLESKNTDKKYLSN